jgi:hypothetical protein
MSAGPAVAPPLPAPATEVVRLPLPQPDEHAEHIDDAHLFGAALFGAAAPAGIHPTPVVAIGGVDVASAPDSSLTYPMVVDGLRVAWGRSEALAQPDPASASLRVFDPTSKWPIGRELIGQLVTMRWVATKPGDPAPTSQVFFVGRITSVKLTRKTVRRSDGVRVPGLLVALSAASLLTDLANITPAVAWPEETLGDRATRIAAAASNVVTSVVVQGYWKTPHVQPFAAADQVSLLEHLLSLYQSSGPSRFSYLPNTQTAQHIGRRDFPTSAAWANLTWNVAGEGTARDGKGAYAISLASGGVDGGLSAVPLYVDGDMIEYAESAALTKDVASRITRVEVAHKDGGASYADVVETQLVSAIDPAVNETTMGVRTARLDSTLVWNAYAATSASDLGYMVAREAAGWRADPITIRTGLSDAGGFETWSQMVHCLTGAEAASTVFLQRSWFAQLGIRPVFGFIGGVIAYVGGEWRCEYQLLPVSTLPALQHAISWSEIDNCSTTYELQWWDDDNPRGLHESLTYEDVAFVGRGLGVTVAPADSGWDRVYP